MTYRPRGTLARALYDKIHNDQYLEGYDMKLVSGHQHLHFYSMSIIFFSTINRHVLLFLLCSGIRYREIYPIDIRKNS